MIAQVLTKGLLEGIVVIALFILTPVIVVWVLIAITRATKGAINSSITNRGRLSLEKTLLDAHLFRYLKQNSRT
jgi:hypothetical protein